MLGLDGGSTLQIFTRCACLSFPQGAHTIELVETVLGTSVWAVGGITQSFPASHNKPGSGPAPPSVDGNPKEGRERTAPGVSSFPAHSGNFGMERVRTLWLVLALGLRAVSGHPQPCGVTSRAGGSLRLAALLPRAPAARARVLAALAIPAPRLPHNLSLDLVAIASPARDPASLARGLCQVLAPPGVVASVAFPEARPELRLLQFLAAATETPVLSILRREARASLGTPVCGERWGPWGAGTGKGSPTSPTREWRRPLPCPVPS